MVIPLKSPFFMVTNRIIMANHGISTSLHHYKWLIKHMFPDRPTVPSLPIKALSATRQARPRPCFTKRGSLDFLAPQGEKQCHRPSPISPQGKKSITGGINHSQIDGLLLFYRHYIYIYLFIYLFIYMYIRIYIYIYVLYCIYEYVSKPRHPRYHKIAGLWMVYPQEYC